MAPAGQVDQAAQADQMVNTEVPVILSLPFERADTQFMKGSKGKIFFIGIRDGLPLPFPVLSDGSIKSEPDQDELKLVTGKKVQLVHPCALGIIEIKWAQ